MTKLNRTQIISAMRTWIEIFSSKQRPTESNMVTPKIKFKLALLWISVVSFQIFVVVNLWLSTLRRCFHEENNNYIHSVNHSSPVRYFLQSPSIVAFIMRKLIREVFSQSCYLVLWSLQLYVWNTMQRWQDMYLVY